MSIHFLRRRKRALAGSLAALMLCSPLTGLATTAYAQPGDTAGAGSMSVPSILLFPFTNNAGATAQSIAPRLDDALKLRLNSVAAYKVTSYTKFLPPVERAALESPPVLTTDDLTNPGTDLQKAGKIAVQVSTDTYLIGAVESFTADPTTRKVSIEVSADLRDTQAGTSLRTLAFTGTAGPTSSSETLDMVIQQAINIVAGRVSASINSGHSTHNVLPMSQRGHSNSGEKVLLVVLLGALSYAILHNSSSSSGSGGTTIVTPPVGPGTGTGGGTISPPSPPF